MKDSGVVYDCRWSNSVDDRFVRDFLWVENSVFHHGYDRNLFNKKFVDNIYGDSVLVVVYVDGHPSAARALWRNDIDGKKAYQPGDTCVLGPCRGKGVFSEMTRRAVALLESGAIIYNFPNQFSFPGYLKLGWHLVHEYHLVFLSNKKYGEEHPVDMDGEYADWWLKGSSGIRYAKRGGLYYLVSKYPRPFCYKVISRVDRSVALRFERVGSFSFLFFYSTAVTWYNKRFASLHMVSKTSDDVRIPVWKMDTVGF